MMMKKMNLLLVLLLIFSVAKAQDIETAYKQLSYGKDADAVSTVKAVINANPESFTDKFSLYSILSAAGKYSEATEVLNTIKAADEKGAYGKTECVIEVGTGS